MSAIKDTKINSNHNDYSMITENVINSWYNSTKLFIKNTGKISDEVYEELTKKVYISCAIFSDFIILVAKKDKKNYSQVMKILEKNTEKKLKEILNSNIINNYYERAITTYVQDMHSAFKKHKEIEPETIALLVRLANPCLITKNIEQEGRTFDM